MTITDVTTRPREAEEFLAAVAGRAAEDPTACAGWTVHDVTAHVAAACEEVGRHVRAFTAGRPLTRTRGFAEREAPFRALPPDRLRAALEDHEAAMRREIGAVLATDPEAVLDWTGRRMRVAAFPTHLRSEFAIHRWDVVGDDAVGAELMGQADLLEHAVASVGSGPLLARGVGAGAAEVPFVARVRAEPQRDLLVRSGSGVGELELVEPSGPAAITTDPAARLLVLWGRTPGPPSRLVVTGDPADAARTRHLLAGY